MPCFLGLAVSIHTPNGPLPEHSVQKQSRAHRITSYIPVPPAKTPAGSTKPEQSTFAISITLLTPGLNVPYSTPKSTLDDPNPKPKVVGGTPNQGDDRGKNGPVIAPYKPLTTSPNETIAAYIYFDGRAKEEVATLLRRGEETWVNSRWVSVLESEGGGLAEREFLFREVGLERWLNGLDLEGKDVAATIERRKQRLEKKRRKKREAQKSDDEEELKTPHRNGVLRYGDNKDAPVESLSGNEDFFTSDSDSEDDGPQPEAAGQIKVALFRVLASGEIKRGEYSPQFDAHDDDEATGQSGAGDGEDVDHTTSFAKPKTLDPKSISTQTVTGIDPPDKPYAVFTFLYRGERQLRKMGILATDKAQTSPVAARRKSRGLDLSALKPLNAAAGTKNFGGYRDRNAKSKRKDEDAMDSDVDEEDGDNVKTEDADAEDEIDTSGKGMLPPEDARRQGELAKGVRKIKLKRQHSAEPLERTTASDDRGTSGSPVSGTPNTANDAVGESSITTKTTSPELGTEGTVGSPFKKHRASLPGFDESVRKSLGATLAGAAASSSQQQKERGNSEGNIPPPKLIETKMDEDEEL